MSVAMYMFFSLQVIPLPHRSSDSSEASGGGEVMDMSVCEDDLLVSDSSPREDLLHARTDDVFDVPEYASDIYHYSRQAEVCIKVFVLTFVLLVVRICML